MYIVRVFNDHSYCFHAIVVKRRRPGIASKRWMLFLNILKTLIFIAYILIISEEIAVQFHVCFPATIQFLD